METIERLGKYEIKRTLGQGAMGIVYEGWDPSIRRRVAIKTVPIGGDDDADSEDAIERFRREAQAAGRLTHPNIVPVYDYGETADSAYIVMEFIAGPTVKSLLERQQRFGLPDILRIMQDLLAGLAYSHERGVVHRDIKPANLMLTSDDPANARVKIADFGIARIDGGGMTLAGTVIGTPAYMSPEQFLAEAVDARTDIYSSGVLLYQLLTGERPFEGGLSAIMHKVLNSDPPPPSRISVSVPPAFDAVVKRAMAKRPAERFASAADFAAALLAAASASLDPGDTAIVRAPEPAAPAAATAGPAGTRTRGLKRVLAAATVTVLVASAGGALLIDRPPAEAPVAATAGSAAAAAGALPKPPGQTQTPPLTPAMIGSVLGQIVAAQHCAFVGGSVSDAGVAVLTGFAGPGVEQSIHQAAAGRMDSATILWRAAATDPVFCPALQLLQTTAPPFDAADLRVDVAMAGGRTVLHDGEVIRPRLVMPNFVGYLRVDYLVHDGTVQHLYPQVADANGTPADRLRMLTAGEHVSLGDAAPGQPVWEVGPPYGTDLIIAIASSQPLFARPRPQNVEPADAYLRDLDEAVQAVRESGGKLAGGALLVDALAK